MVPVTHKRKRKRKGGSERVLLGVLAGMRRGTTREGGGTSGRLSEGVSATCRRLWLIHEEETETEYVNVISQGKRVD